MGQDMPPRPPTPKDAAKVLLGAPVELQKGGLNALSFLVQAALAMRNGKPKRAFLLLGMASVAHKHKKLSWAFQGALAADDLRRKLF